MLNIKCIPENYSAYDMNFIDLVRYFEIFRSHPDKKDYEIEFRTYLKAYTDHKGIIEVIPDHQLRKYYVSSSLFSLLGQKGVLPSHYTEYIINCSREGDVALYDFLDIFYNKLMRAFYEIIRSSDLVINLQHYALSSKEQMPTPVRQLSSFIGISHTDYTQDLNLLIKYCGVMIYIHRPAIILQNVLSKILRTNVTIVEYVPIKVILSTSQITLIGKKNHVLGDSLYIGEHAFLWQNKIRVEARELDLDIYKKFMQHRFLKDSLLHKILSFYLGHSMEYEPVFEVKKIHRKTQILVNTPPTLGTDTWCSI